METLASDRVARGAIITGGEKCFAAGADLSEVSALHAADGVVFAALGQTVMRAVGRSAKPVVAAIRGYCMGGGFDLALACHARFATPDAVFAHRGAALGIITGWGGTQRLPRIAGLRGPSLAKQLMVTGESMDAEQAYGMGVVTRLVAPEILMREAHRFIAVH